MSSKKIGDCEKTQREIKNKQDHVPSHDRPIVIQDDIVTFPLILGPDPSTAVVVDPIEHLSHPTEVTTTIHREEKEDRALITMR